MIKRTAYVLTALAVVCPTLMAQEEADFDSSTFAGLRARSIGPAAMSGRIASIDVAPTDPATIYVGSASGGVWRSKNGGTNFSPIFDAHTQSIGAVRVDPNDTQTIWVGTGESRVRNSVSAGTGVYVSRDGGDNWTHKGLDESRHIAQLLVHPENASRIWVCVTGNAFADHAQRGVFRSDDGGDSWENVLYIDDSTGCGDLAYDPSNPEVLYAGLWDFRRQPDFFRSGGPGSGLHKSTDGGSTWRELTEGLPDTDMGRIAIAVAPSETDRVYAVVESKDTGLYRSDDAGATWSLMNTSAGVQFRPFYFGELVVDPLDADRVYRPGFMLVASDDGGKTFGGMFSAGGGVIHPDHHWLWINPKQPTHLIIGTDGGLYESHNRGVHWRFVASLPVSQFYHVSADMDVPYNVYGGLQDNGSWTGPSHRSGGVRNKHWDSVGYGDGFWVFADPTDDNTVFSEYQGGKLLRVDRRTNEVKSIAPSQDPDGEKLRFNWNTPIHLSPSRPGTLYYGSQYLHRSTDRGDSWTRISPDLTTDDPERQRQAQTGGVTIDNSTAENNTTIYTISESPKDANTIWVGTDDGLVQVTRDGGANWRDVTRNIEGLPEGLWVSRVEASPHDAATAFVTVDGHRSGDNGVYVHVTRDHGASWSSLVTDEIEGHAWVIKQDPVVPELLYLGTEFGLYLSLDGGRHWARFSENLPKVAVHDLFVHPRDHDLIVGTHGRGVYIVDDLTPLRALTDELRAADAALLPSRPQAMWTGGALQEFASNDEFFGEGRSESAVIAYHLKKRHMFGDLRVKIYDATGKEVGSLAGGKRRGMNRVDWPMRLKAPRLPPSTQLVPAFTGPRLPEGTYTVELLRGEDKVTGSVELVGDPRSPHSAEDRRVQQATAIEIYEDLADLTYLADNIAGLRSQADARAESASGQARALKRFSDRLAQFTDALSASKQGMITGEEKLREEYGQLYGAVVGYDGRPTASQLASHRRLRTQLDAAIAQADAYIGTELPKLNEDLEREQQPPLVPVDRAVWDDQGDGGGSLGSASAREVRRLPDALRSLFGLMY